MQTIPNLPAQTPSESIGDDSGNPPNALSESENAFCAASWLAGFEQVGGGYVVTDRLGLAILVEDGSDDDIHAARRMIIKLSEAERRAIVDHLKADEIRSRPSEGEV
jgi:hypothetical protein